MPSSLAPWSILAVASTLLSRPVRCGRALPPLAACSPPARCLQPPCPDPLLCLRQLPVEPHPSSQLRDRAAWGHQQVEVFFSQALSACVSQGRESSTGTQRSLEKTRTGGVPFYRMALLAEPSSLITSPRLVAEPSILFPALSLFSGGVWLRSGTGREHSQLVGTAVVELELRADKRPPRLPRLQLQHHAEPVWGCKPEPVSPGSGNEGSDSRRGGTRSPPASVPSHLLLG